MGWINDSAAAVWRAGYSASRLLAPRAARVTRPEPTPGQTHIIGVPKQTGGVRVTPETALQISAVWACVSVISKDIAASTWDVFQDKPGGERVRRRDTPLFRLLNSDPNPEMTAFAFREALLVSALLWGDGYAEIERDASGRAVALWPIHPDRVEQERDANGALIYRVWNPVGPEVFLPSGNVLHIHGPGVEGLVGFDVIRLAATLFGHTLAADLFGAAFYGNGAHAGQVFETEQLLNKDQVTELRGEIVKALQGADKQLGVLIATHGAKLKNMGVEPEAAQFNETRQHQIEDIARWFDVPPHKIGHLLRATFSNIEEQGKDYVNKIVPWCERLKQETQKKVVGRRSITTRIDVEWLAEGNAKDKAEADAILVNNGIKRRNEIRERRGDNSLGPDGDKLTVQMNMTTLDRIGEEPAAAPPAPPAEDDEAPRLRLITGGTMPQNKLTEIQPAQSARKPFSMKAANGVGEIFLFDDIGDSFDGTTAKSFATDLKSLGQVRRLDVFINSPGGSVFDGVAIFNQLKRHPAEKNVMIDGIAASIASVIAMAGDRITIASNGFVMIHDPWVIAMGGPAEMRKVAEQLDKVRDSIVDTYAARTGAAPNVIADMMAEETWMTAAEAVDLGFADAVGEDAAMAARFDLAKFRHVPETVAAKLDVTKNPPPIELKSKAAGAADGAKPGSIEPADPSDWENRARIKKARRRLEKQGVLSA
jgi:HK97 family phage portal protein